MAENIMLAMKRLHEASLECGTVSGGVLTGEKLWRTEAMQKVALLALRLRHLCTQASLAPTEADRAASVDAALCVVNSLEEIIVEISTQMSPAAREFVLRHDAMAVEVMNACDVVRAEVMEMLQAHAESSLRMGAQINELKTQVGDLQAKLDRLSEHKLHHEHVRERVWGMTGGHCFYCDVEMVRNSQEDPRRAFEIDHIVPRSHGGPDHVSNYVPSCAKCNGEKNNKHFVEFMVSKRRGADCEAPFLRLVGGGA